MRFKLLSDVEELNVLPIEAQKLADPELTILDTFLSSPGEDSQLPTGEREAGNPFDIITEPQLLQWASRHPKRLLDAFTQTRVDRDTGIRCIRDWNGLVAKYEKAEANYEAMKAKYQAVEAKETEFAAKKTEFAAKKEEFKATIKQLQADNIALRKAPSPKGTMDKKERSAKHPNPPKFKHNTDELPYETWEVLVRDKLRINQDHWDSESIKAALVISWTEGQARNHLFARRRKHPDFFQTLEFVFQVLDLIFAEKNVDRIVRHRFKNLRMKSNQIFPEFFSEFILLTDQMIDTSKQTKVDELREKLTPQLQKAIVSNGKFHTVEALKTLVEHVDLELNSIVYDKQDRQDNKGKARASKGFSRDNTSQKTSNISATGNRRTLSKNQTQTLRNIKQKNGGRIGCYECGEDEHFAKDCPHGHHGETWLQKEVKKELNLIEEAQMHHHLISVDDDAASAISSDSELTAESKN